MKDVLTTACNLNMRGVRKAVICHPGVDILLGASENGDGLIEKSEPLM
jgi:hypothetical protein